MRYMKQFKEEANVDQVGFTGLFTVSNLRKRVIIACGLVIAQQLAGVNAFLSCAGTIFTKCEFDDPILINVCFNWLMIVFCACPAQNSCLLACLH